MPAPVVDAPIPSRPFSSPRALLVAAAATMAAYFLVAGVRHEAIANKVVLWSLVGLAAGWWYHLTIGAWLRSPKSFWRWFPKALGLVFVGYLLLLLISLIIPPMPEPPEPTRNDIQLAVVLISLGWQPFIEELVFRGFLYQAAARRGVGVALLVTVAADFAAHYSTHGLDYSLRTIPGAVISALLRLWSGGVLVPTAFHATLNGLLEYGPS